MNNRKQQSREPWLYALSIYLSIHLSIYPSIHLSIHHTAAVKILSSEIHITFPIQSKYLKKKKKKEKNISFFFFFIL